VLLNGCHGDSNHQKQSDHGGTKRKDMLVSIDAGLAFAIRLFCHGASSAGAGKQTGLGASGNAAISGACGC